MGEESKLALIWHSRRLIAITSILCALVAVAVGLLLPADYTTAATLVLHPPVQVDPFSNNAPTPLAGYTDNAVATLSGSRFEKSALGSESEKIAYTVTQRPNTNVLDITVSAPSRMESLDGAKRILDAFTHTTAQSVASARDGQTSQLDNAIIEAQKQLATLNEQLQKLPSGTLATASLTTQLQDAQANLSSLQSARRKLDVTYAGSPDPVEIVSSPEQVSSSRRAPYWYFAAGLLAGLLLTIAFLLVRATMNPRIVSVTQLVRRGYPAIPAIPRLPSPFGGDTWETAASAAVALLSSGGDSDRIAIIDYRQTPGAIDALTNAVGFALKRANPASRPDSIAATVTRVDSGQEQTSIGDSPAKDSTGASAFHGLPDSGARVIVSPPPARSPEVLGAISAGDGVLHLVVQGETPLRDLQDSQEVLASFGVDRTCVVVVQP